MIDHNKCRHYRVTVIKQGKKDYVQCVSCDLKIEVRKLFHTFYELVHGLTGFVSADINYGHIVFK
jgi:hypothetical protein